LRVASVVAIEGAIDYYKQGLRIVNIYIAIIIPFIDSLKRAITV
jgi:hypothetical protein